MDQPIFPAPPGYIVDLANPQRSGVAANFWVGSVGMVIAALFLCTRIYTKTVLARSFTSDDGALVVAWLFSIAIQAPILFQYARGTIGVHVWELSGSRLNSSFILINIASILYCPFLACAKFSLLFFYLKLSHLRWFKLCIYASMFLVIGYNFALMLPLIFACRPFMRAWDITITEGSCIDRTPIYMATAVLNIITDILLLVLPIPMIVKLQMPTKQKAGLICIFGVGAATCVTSGVRLALLFPMLKTIDQTWAIVMPGLWILIEANLVIITGSLPTMRLFFRHVAPHLIGESTLRSQSNKKGTDYANGSAQLSELKTIGSKKGTKSAYNRMEDDNISVGSDERTAAGWHTDRDSERGIVAPIEAGKIMKTETTVVRSDVVDVDKRERESWKVGF
ncbi:hypothetical protein FB567DRAFT_601183 [Paraphoma chrysanthemicola]|uniref:Rhodopsin domain-containing protein n=1 Tax=Paraphoma chrysanthemicola TaxID=798071 RepID=A0A8K0RHX3_9PLEO|nr:hypothetical protein FB567DRAFT_601183 [Paraphoma chrysanthemicola]